MDDNILNILNKQLIKTIFHKKPISPLTMKINQSTILMDMSIIRIVSNSFGVLVAFWCKKSFIVNNQAEF